MILAPGLEIDKIRMMRVIRTRHLGRITEGPSAFGPSGLNMGLSHPDEDMRGSIVVTQSDFDGAEWIHASLAWSSRVPDYAELCTLKDAIFGPERYAYQVFAPVSQHVSIHDYALHLWGRADGTPVLPEFGQYGTI